MQRKTTPFLKPFYMPLLLILAACDGVPKDDGMLPLQPFPQPRSFEANPLGGHVINHVSGDSIQPIINSLGDTVRTGIPILTTPRVIHPDSIAAARVIDAPVLENLERHNAHPNRQLLPKNIPRMAVDHSRLKKVILGEGNADFLLINSTGDTIPTGVPVPAKGKKVKAIQPAPVKALPPGFKDAAVANFQYLDVDQGMNASYVYSTLEDTRGNLWFGTLGGGVSQYDGTSFRHFTTKEGLSDNTVLSILEDKKGNLWFGTDGGGVSCYDGAFFTHFTDNEGLSHNSIYTILEDKNGNIWFGTHGGGISCYDGESFTHYTEKEGLSDNRILALLEDKSGNLWIGTNGGGLTYYVPSQQKGPSYFMHFTEKEGLCSNRIFAMLEDNKGQLWFGTAAGIGCYDDTSFKFFTEQEGLGSNHITAMVEDRNGHLWFGSGGSGVSYFDGSSFENFTDKEGLSNNVVSSILEDKQGNLWFSTRGGGAAYYDGASFTHFTQSKGFGNGVISILEDQHEDLWFGAEGVIHYNGTSYAHLSKEDSFGNSSVYAILEDHFGNLWFGTWEDGVRCYIPPKKGETGSIKHYTVKEGLSGNTVLSILEDSKGNVWFGTLEGGVTCYEPPADGQVGRFTQFTEREGLSNNTVSSILEDKNGGLWFGTWGGGLSYYNPSCHPDSLESGPGAFAQRSSLGKGEASFMHFTEKEGLNNNRVSSIIEDAEGNLWFGTFGGGVGHYDGVTFTHFTEKEGLSHNTVYSIVEDKSLAHGVGVWVSTEKGITQIIKGKEHIKDGSPKALGRGEKLDTGQVTKEKYKIRKFVKHDGLKALDFLINSAFIDSQNRAWWGSGKSLTVLDLNKFHLAQHPPLVFLKQIDIGEKYVDYRHISDSVNKEIQFSAAAPFENYPLDLVLPFDQNHLTFHFSAIDWAAPHKITYSHRMLGLHNVWSTPSQESKADYRNLPFGTYTIQIRAIGESGEWSEPFEYTFIIRPPWWHTWWAYAMYTFLFLLALWLFSKWRERTLKSEKLKLEQTVAERTLELKSSQAQLIHAEKMASLGELTAGIAHEIQNPLNFVNNFSEVSSELIQEMHEEMEKGDIEEAKAISSDIKQNLEKIAHHGKRADAIVKGMLAHSRSGKGEKIPTDINALAEEYLKLSYHGLRAKDKSFNAEFKTDLDPTLPKVNVVPQDIGRVLLNLINNAFQACDERSRSADAEKTGHAVQTGHAPSLQPLITVTTKNLGNKIEISVKDNGPGIPEAIKDKIFQPFFTTKPTGQGTGLGLSLSYDIVKAHGGEITISSQEGEYTKCTVRLPTIS